MGEHTRDDVEAGTNPENSGPDSSDKGTLGDWLVILALLVAFVAIPWALILVPEVRAATGGLAIPYRDAYLVVPLVPAIALGILGVWTALRSREC